MPYLTRNTRNALARPDVTQLVRQQSTDTRILSACRARVRYKACLSGWLPTRSWAIPPCAMHIRLEKICDARATRISRASRALKEKQALCRESMPQCVNDNAALSSTRDDPKRIV